jgi:predicted nuclease with TOPRIM domain
MAESNIQIIERIKESYYRLKNLYEEQKAINQKLKTENEKIIAEIDEKKDRILNLEAELNKIKLAHALIGESDNKQDAKQKINKMVREIDKCIALLNK